MAKANPIEIQKHLKGIDYPASKQELVSHAQKQGGDRQVISLLEQLPDGEEFETQQMLTKLLLKFSMLKFFIEVIS